MGKYPSGLQVPGNSLNAWLGFVGMVGTFFFEKDLFGLDTIPNPSERTEISVQSTEIAVRPGPVRMKSIFFIERTVFTFFSICLARPKPVLGVQARPGPSW